MNVWVAAEPPVAGGDVALAAACIMYISVPYIPVRVVVYSRERERAEGDSETDHWKILATTYEQNDF